MILLVLARFIAKNGGTLLVFLVSAGRFPASEDTLEDAKRMFHFGPNSRLSRVLAPGFFIHMILVSGPAASHILCLRRGSANSFSLALIAAIAPYLALLAVQ